MLPTNYHVFDKAIDKAKLRNELSVILSHIENDRYLSDDDKRELRLKLYQKLEYTY